MYILESVDGWMAISISLDKGLGNDELHENQWLRHRQENDATSFGDFLG